MRAFDSHVQPSFNANLQHTQSAIDFAVLFATHRRDETTQNREPGSATNPKSATIQPSPHHRHGAPTHVQPKGVLEEYKNVDTEVVTHSFSSAFPNLGIRSLPNALQPGFREWLIRCTSEKEHSQPKANFQAHGNNSFSAPSLMWPANGQRKPPKHSTLAQSFSTFEYQHSSYERERELNCINHLKSCKSRVSSQDFVVRHVPLGPKSAPAFSEFDYKESPYDALLDLKKSEAQEKREGVLYGPMCCGNVEQTTILKGRLRECMRTLSKYLLKDWPESFLQVFEDPKGCIVVSFDKEKAMVEGDATAFMNRLAVDHPLIAEFHLFRDSNLWGVEDSSSPSVFYIFWPRWAHHRAIVSERLAGPIPKMDKPMQEWNPTRASQRDPFGQRTASGLLVQQCVAAFDHSLRL